MMSTSRTNVRFNKRLGASLLGLTALTSSAAAATPDGAALVEQKFCYSCHHATQDRLGPSFHAIAARHGARSARMLPVLAYKIRAGGGGAWGFVPMVPSQNVTAAEATAIATWILGQK
jgi:cytochrome c